MSKKLFNQIRKYERRSFVHYIKRPVLFINRLGVAITVPQTTYSLMSFKKIIETLSYLNTVKSVENNVPVKSINTWESWCIKFTKKEQVTVKTVIRPSH